MSISAYPISRNKVIIPQLRQEVIRRRRLLALFSDLLDRKLILITAPAGYGKTTLLLDYASQAGMPVCWLSLDALDRDPQRFIAYLIAAIAERFPNFGQLSDACLKSVTSLEQDTERLLATLTNEIHEQIDEHFALVIDDYHLVDPIPAVRDLLSRFIFLAGENCHIILASRRLPALPEIALMVARQQVGGFDFEQLVFEREETQLLLEKTLGVRPTNQVIDELMRQTEGWVTGLLLSASMSDGSVSSHAGGKGRNSLHRAARSAGVNLADYFDQQILAVQPAEVREFLLHSSLLEEFDANLCDAVLGAGHWRDLIDTVRQGNLFILQVGPNGEWVRYHPLFQEFLKQRIQHEELDAARAILGRLAEVHEKNGEWDKAHAIYQQFANAGLLAALLERAGSGLLLGEHLVTLAGWLDELPASLLHEKPALLSLKGALLCARGEGQAALKLLEEAIPGLLKEYEASNLALGYIRRAAAYRLTGEHQRSLQDADEALRLCQKDVNLGSILPEAELFKGISLANLGRIEEAVLIHEEALKRYEKLGEPQNAARVQMCLGSEYQNTNNQAAAEHAFKQALNEWKAEANLASQASTLNGLGVMYHRTGEYKQAVMSFEQGLECARRGGSAWREALIMTSLGDIYLDLDEFEAAGDAFARAATIANRISYRFLSTYLNLAQARLARLRGQVRNAHLQLSKAEAAVNTGSSSSTRGQFHLERGCLDLFEKKTAAARAELNLALDIFQQGDQPLEADRCRIWLAAGMLAGEDPKSAISHLRVVLENPQAENDHAALIQDFRRALPWLSRLEDEGSGQSLSTWLDKAAEHERRLPALRKNLRRMLTSVPIQAPHLTIHGFGKAQVRVSGKLISPNEWKTNSVRELFFFLLSRQRPVTKDEIGEVLWTGINPDSLKLRFKNNLYRLRNALGQESVLFENDQYSFNRLLDFEYDIEDFGDQLAKARLSSSRDEKIACLRAATALRQGPYLSNIDATWVLAERERLEQACLAAFKQLAELLHQGGELIDALQACREALKIDSCREDFHRLAMQLHASMGDRLGVIWQYQNCLQTLEKELGVAVSEETEALYRRLISA